MVLLIQLSGHSGVRPSSDECHTLEVGLNNSILEAGFEIIACRVGRTKLLLISLKPRLSVPDFVSQLWRKIDFSPKLQDKIQNGKPGFEANC